MTSSAFLLLASMWLSAAQEPSQDNVQEPGQDAPPAQVAATSEADPAARAAWQSFLDATRGDAPSQPITAFSLQASVLTRAGVQTNEMSVDYRFLEPECIRFLLPNQREVGRFGAKQREYWLRDRDELVVLSGRDYTEDRRQIDEMFSIARNFVALSDPARLSITSLELLAKPPADLSKKIQRESAKLRWLRATSPDFALMRNDGTRASEGTLYVIDLALQPSGEARFVIVRERPAPGQPVAEPMLIRMDDFRGQNGFRIPYQFFVYRLDPSALPLVFGSKPAQEIYLTKADLRATLAVEDFQP